MPWTPDIVSVSGENFFHFNLFYYNFTVDFFRHLHNGRARELRHVSENMVNGRETHMQ